MVAGARQVLHEQIFHVQANFLTGALAHGCQIQVATGALHACKVVIPVGAVLDFHLLACNQRNGTRDGLMVLALRVDKRFIIVGPRFEVIVQDGLIGVVEDLDGTCDSAAALQLQLAVAQLPPALPAILVFPTLGIAATRARFHVVEVHVFGARTIGPGVFAGNGTGMATEAFVQVHHHRDLGFNPQANRPPSSCEPPQACRAGCPWCRNS